MNRLLPLAATALLSFVVTLNAEEKPKSDFTRMISSLSTADRMLPDDFPKEEFRLFLGRGKKTFDDIRTGDRTALARHPSVFGAWFDGKGDKSITVQFNFSRAGELPESIRNLADDDWTVDLVQIFFGTDFGFTIKNESAEFHVVTMRLMERGVECEMHRSLEFLTYRENQTPDSRYGMSCSVRSNDERRCRIIDFETFIIREIVFDETSRIIENATKVRKTGKDYSYKPLNRLPEPDEKTLFSTDMIRKFQLPDVKNDKVLYGISEELDLIYRSIQDDILLAAQHNTVTKNNKYSQTYVAMKWKYDRTFQYNIEHVLDDQDKARTGCEITFGETGIPIKYVSGNRPPASSESRHFKFSGFEVTFYPNGNPKACCIYKNGTKESVHHWTSEGIRK